MNKFCSIVIIGVTLISGCAESNLNLINTIDKPTPAQLTMHILRSNCSDLKVKEERNIPQDEFFKQVILTRTAKYDPAKSCVISCYGGSRLMQNVRQAQCQQVVDTEILRQQNESDQQSAQAEVAARKAEDVNRKIYADIENKGYQQMMFDDFHLDEDRLPVGKKIYIKGYYEVVGELQYLVKSPSIQYPYPQYQIPVYTKNADRNARQLLLNNAYHCAAGQGVCEITLVGTVAQCNITTLGSTRNKSCISMDSLLYEATLH